MSNEPIEPTHQTCPEAYDGGTHHLVPTGPTEARYHVCRFCKATEQELRERGRELTGRE